MVECYHCGKEYLTEADPHAWVFEQHEWRNNCGCFFIKKGIKECIEKLRELQGQFRHQSKWNFSNDSKFAPVELSDYLLKELYRCDL